MNGSIYTREKKTARIQEEEEEEERELTQTYFKLPLYAHRVPRAALATTACVTPGCIRGAPSFSLGRSEKQGYVRIPSHWAAANPALTAYSAVYLGSAPANFGGENILVDRGPDAATDGTERIESESAAAEVISASGQHEHGESGSRNYK